MKQTGSGVRALAATFRSVVWAGRAALEARGFSVLAGWIVRAIGVVTVLSLVAESVVGGVVGLVAFGLYVAVGYDRFYGEVVQRVRLGRISDFAVRTVGYVLGALALTGLFAALGVVDPTGTFAGLLPGTNPVVATLFDGLGVLPVGLLLVVLGGLLLVEAGAMLVQRVALSRADTYVGVSAPTGRVTLTATVSDGHDDDGSGPGDWPDLEVTFDEDGSESGGVDATGGTDEDPYVADGGRTTTTDGSGNPDERDLLALAAYDSEDPVVVETESNRVVATRTDCHPDEWIDAVVTYLVEDFYEEYGVDLRGDRETLHRLRIVAKRIREDLEERTETELLVPFVAEVPGEGSVHLRKQLSVVTPSNGAEVRPPFATVGTVPVDSDRDEGNDPATFDPGMKTGRPVDEPADEPVVDVESPSTRSVTAPRSGTDCVAYVHRARENRTRTVDVAGRTIPVSGRCLAAFESELTAFEVETFGTTIRVDPEDVDLWLAERPVDGDTGVVHEGRIESGDIVTVVGDLEPVEGRDWDYELREGPPGGVIVSDRSPGDLSSAITRGIGARVAAAVPLLVVGTWLAPQVPLSPAVVLGVALAVVALGTAVASGAVLVQYLPDYLRKPAAGAVSALLDRS